MTRLLLFAISTFFVMVALVACGSMTPTQQNATPTIVPSPIVSPTIAPTITPAAKALEGIGTCDRIPKGYVVVFDERKESEKPTYQPDSPKKWCVLYKTDDVIRMIPSGYYTAFRSFDSAVLITLLPGNQKGSLKTPAFMGTSVVGMAVDTQNKFVAVELLAGTSQHLRAVVNDEGKLVLSMDSIVDEVPVFAVIGLTDESYESYVLDPRVKKSPASNPTASPTPSATRIPGEVLPRGLKFSFSGKCGIWTVKGVNALEDTTQLKKVELKGSGKQELDGSKKTLYVFEYGKVLADLDTQTLYVESEAGYADCMSGDVMLMLINAR